MVEASPASTFVVVEADLVLQLLIVTLYPPAELGQQNEADQQRGLRQSRQPVLDWLGLVVRPFDHQPLRRSRGATVDVAVRWTDS